ncbi:substrate-binding periplasmic protein [Zooshikella harenae]|uniref:ABC transporter substrate-binding protein n=1 Tax=Zooshikella harenae TaxID=2827238 RepID=A0ABS5ZJ98_9GAMM|nr:transporter substrate-binding domain-containing protein [Zooshikella harenae]MBU2714044.1 ABC transporter substrate-binding protein [Zooshikella harenae]
MWIHFVFVLLLLILQSARAEPTPVTLLGDYNYYPYSYVEGNKLKGLYPLIIRRVLSRMPNYHATLEGVPWKRGLKLLQTGKAFALFPPYKHEATRPYIAPYSKPLLAETVAVFCRAEILTTSRPRWPDDYYGLTMGINLGYELGGDAFWAAVKDQKIELREYGSNRLNLIKLLVAGQTDCYVNSRQAILLSWRQLKQENHRQMMPLVEGAIVSVEYGHLGYTNQASERYPYKDDFVQAFDRSVEALQQSGELKRLIEAYWQHLLPTEVNQGNAQP